MGIIIWIICFIRIRDNREVYCSISTHFIIKNLDIRISHNNNSRAFGTSPTILPSGAKLSVSLSIDLLSKTLCGGRLVEADQVNQILKCRQYYVKQDCYIHLHSKNFLFQFQLRYIEQYYF